MNYKKYFALLGVVAVSGIAHGAAPYGSQQAMIDLRKQRLREAGLAVDPATVAAQEEAARQAAAAAASADAAHRAAALAAAAEAENRAIEALAQQADQVARDALAANLAAKLSESAAEEASAYLNDRIGVLAAELSVKFRTDVDTAQRQLANATRDAKAASAQARTEADNVLSAATLAEATAMEARAGQALQKAVQASQQAEAAKNEILRADAKLIAIERLRFEELIDFYHGVLARQHIGLEDQRAAVAAWDGLDDNVRIQQAWDAYTNFKGDPVYKSALTSLP